MADFGKISPEKAQAIIKALKDGKINQQEMQKLGLSEEAAKALNEAFASGAAEIGDFVLINKGQKTTKNGKKVQLSSTQKKKKNENSTFMERLKTVGKTVGKYVGITAAGAGVAAAVVAGGVSLPVVAAVVAGALLTTSCIGGDTETNYDFTNNNNNTVNLTVKQELSSLEGILNKILAKQTSSDNTLKDLLAEVKSLKGDVNANAEQVQALLRSILAAIGNNTDLLNIVVDGIGQNNDLIQVVIDKITEGNQTLNDIKNLIVKNHADDVNYQQKALKLLADIKTAISKLNADMNTNYNNILKSMVTQGASLATIEALLRTINANVEKINALVTKYGDKGTELGNAIFNAISKLNFNTTVDLSGIEALLKKIADKNSPDYTEQLNNITNLIKQLDANNNAKLEKIFAAIEKIGLNVSGQLSIIIGKIDKSSPDYSAQLDKIINLLGQLDANNETRNKKVLDAIAKLGNSVSGDLTAILAAINKMPQSQQKDYTNVLNAILDKIKEGNAQNDANFKAVLAKIKDLGVNVAFGMNAIMEAIQKQPDYSSRLDAIIARLDKLGAKAQEILEAIKDHDVKITVDVTGKVKCECNCNCGDGGKHEGIIGDLNDLLG